MGKDKAIDKRANRHREEAGERAETAPREMPRRLWRSSEHTAAHNLGGDTDASPQASVATAVSKTEGTA